MIVLSHTEYILLEIKRQGLKCRSGLLLDEKCIYGSFETPFSLWILMGWLVVTLNHRIYELLL